MTGVGVGGVGVTGVVITGVGVEGVGKEARYRCSRLGCSYIPVQEAHEAAAGGTTLPSIHRWAQVPP